jgi:hypothetical protein
VKRFRVFDVETNETIIIIRKESIMDASTWVYEVYGGRGRADVEPLDE